MKQKVDCAKFSVEFNSVRIAAHKERPAVQAQVNSTLTRSFHQKSSGAPCLLSEDFKLSCINKDQLKDFYNYLNQKVITTINILDGSTMGDNLITSHQIDYMS